MMWWPRTALARILLSGVTAAAAIIVTTPGPAFASWTEVSCTPWQALHVTGIGGQPLVVRNKPSINNNDQGMCLSVQMTAPDFTVTRSPGTATSPTVRAYPYIGTGCFEGACSSAEQGALPRAAALGNYTVNWATTTPRNSGRWNSSLDIWCGPHSGSGVYEIMIWLQYSGPQWWVGKYPEVWVDGVQWYEVPHTTAAGRYYISFRRATPVKSASLRLAPFMARAMQLGDLDSTAVMWAVQAGFEIWSGGQGLAITRFSVYG